MSNEFIWEQYEKIVQEERQQSDLGYAHAGNQKGGPTEAKGFNKKTKSPSKFSQVSKKKLKNKVNKTMEESNKSKFDTIFESIMAEEDGKLPFETDDTDDFETDDTDDFETDTEEFSDFDEIEDTEDTEEDSDEDFDASSVVSQIEDLLNQLKSHLGMDDGVETDEIDDIDVDIDFDDAEEVEEGYDIENEDEEELEEAVDAEEVGHPLVNQKKGNEYQNQKNMNVHGVKSGNKKAQAGAIKGRDGKIEQAHADASSKKMQTNKDMTANGTGSAFAKKATSALE